MQARGADEAASVHVWSEWRRTLAALFWSKRVIWGVLALAGIASTITTLVGTDWHPPLWLSIAAAVSGIFFGPVLAFHESRVQRDRLLSGSLGALTSMDGARCARLKQRIARCVASGERLLRDLRALSEFDTNIGPLPIAVVRAMERVDDWPKAIADWIERTRDDLREELPPIAANRFPPQTPAAYIPADQRLVVPIEDVARRVEILKAMLGDLGGESSDA